MSYYVESDGDRVPKDVYICDSDEGRILTMECASEDRRFRLARRICNMLNGSDAGFNSVARAALKKQSQ
jgi:hypothetical protein